jgi:hypothetical protein
MDEEGTSSWCVTWGSDKDDFCSGVTAGMDSYAYAVGDFRNNSDDSGIDFDPGSGTDIHVSGGYADACLVKYNNIGYFVKAVHWGSFSNDIAYGISQFVSDTDDSIYVTGAYSDAVDFDPGPDEYWLGYEGGADVYLSRFNLDLTHDWTYTWGGAQDDYSWGVAQSQGQFFYVIGFFMDDNVEFDPCAGTDLHSCKGSEDAFLVKYLSNGCWE